MKIFVDPATIVPKVLSKNEETRRVGFRQLGIRFDLPSGGTPEVDDVRLFAANLDSDDELERVLVYRIGLDRVALIFDHDGNTWWRVGEFSDWKLEDHRLVEVRPAVGMHDDVIVRQRSTGSGFSQIDLTIYRLLQGRLYAVFRTTEEEDYDTSGPGKAGNWYLERRNLEFPVEDDDRQRFLIVHHTKAKDGGTARSLRCSVFRWDVSAYSFVLDPAAASTYCDQVKKRPLTSAAP